MPFPLIKQLIANDDPGVKKNKPDMKLINEKQAESLVLDSKKIENILNKTQKSHALLTVQINDNKNICSSLLLEVNSRENYLVIDEFFPKEINQTLNLNEKLDISCHYSGSSLRFLGEILDVSEQNSSPYYKIPYPDIIEYSQRRQSHRVPISISSPIKVTFTTLNNALVHGELRDISYGGFCARLNPPLIERFKPNDQIPRCIVQMPDSSLIVCSIEVRRMFPASL